MNLLKSFWLTLFPPVCVVCGRKLSDDEEFICVVCRDDMPLTHNWSMPNNPLFMRINEKEPIAGAMSLFHYTSEDRYINIILSIKFKNQRKLAIETGRWMASFFEYNGEIKNIDYLVPLPLHRSRQMWRGFNQSEYICRGLSEYLAIPILNNVVVRHKKSKVQSKLKGEQRISNVNNIFSVKDFEQLNGRSILLVDDVITTGSTICSCIKTIKKSAPKCKIYIASASSTR